MPADCRIGAAVEQRRDDARAQRTCGDVQRRDVEGGVARMHQRRILGQHRHHAGNVVPFDRAIQIVGGGCPGHAASRVSPLLLFFFDDTDDSVVAACDGDCVGRCRIAMGINAVARVGAMGHEHAHDIRCVLEHGIVQHLKVGVRHPRQLRACVQHRLHFSTFRRADRVDQSLRRDVVRGFLHW